jgi:EPS-associated MarR family transcriptional regulator
MREEIHLRVLRTLDANPQMNQRVLARALGVSLGKTNYCIKALLARGLIMIQNFRKSDNKLAYAYVLTPRGMTEKAELTARFLVQKIAEYEAIKSEIEALRLEVEKEQA